MSKQIKRRTTQHDAAYIYAFLCVWLTLERAKTEVVVVLLGQRLLRASVQDSHLLGQLSRSQKSLREQHDLADLHEIRHDHGHGSEQGLEVVGQL